jgi:hypothetical protein
VAFTRRVESGPEDFSMIKLRKGNSRHGIWYSTKC